MSFTFGGGSGGGFGQNNNNNAPSNGFGGGGFGSNTNSGSAFGSSNTGAFGGGGNNTGGSLFGGGGNNAGSNAFGNTGGGFGSTASTGFGAAKPAFGSTAATGGGGGLFGSSSNTTGASGFGGFGSNAQSSSTGFGTNTTNNTSLFGGANKGGFGAATTTPSLFGNNNSSNTNPGFGGGATGGFGATNNPGLGPTGEPPGTGQVAFQPFQEKEATSNATNSFQNILFQEPYKKWSAEELRLADYSQNRRYGNNAGGGFGTNTFGGFGSSTNNTSTGFGSTNTGSGGMFGGQTNTAANTGGGFGASNNTTGAFGSGGLFGQNNNQNKAGGLFGSNTTTSAPAAGGLFGSGNANNNNTATTGSAFGSGAGGGIGANTQSGGLFGQSNQNNAQNKPFGSGFGSGGAGFGSTNTTTGNQGGFGLNTGNTGGSGLFSNNTNTGGSAFGSSTTNTFGGGGSAFGSSNTGGGLFGNNNNNNTQQQNQAKPGGLFGGGGTSNTTAGGLFGGGQNNTNAGGFGANNNSNPAGGGGLFGNNSQTKSGGLFGGASNAGQAGSTSLFGNSQPAQTQNQSGGLFGSQQAKPNLFGSSTAGGGGLFGGQSNTQQSGGLFGNSLSQPQQQNTGLGGSLFNNSTQATPQAQSLTASINDVSAFGSSSLFGSLGGNEVANPGPLATPLSNKSKPRRSSILPMYKLNPASASRFVTPQKRGFGFSYSTYGTPNSASSVASTPGGPGQSLLANSLSRGLSKSMSTNSLRRSFNTEDSILSPGAFSTSSGARYPHGSTGGVKKLVINRNMRSDLFQNPADDSVNGSRKLTKRVSFDPRDVPAIENGDINGSGRATPDAGKNSPRGPANGLNGKATPPLGGSAPETANGKELTVVVEDHTANSPSQSTPKPSGENEAGEYWMTPTKEEILNMNRVQRQTVKNFTVGRKNVGSLHFKVPVDLSNIDLDNLFGDIIDLQIRSATVYPVTAKKPPVGKGLNVPTLISLENSWPRGMDRKATTNKQNAAKLQKHVERLRRIPDTSFVDYCTDTGIWTFSVEHFTTYGLDYDEDEEEGDVEGKGALPPQSQGDDYPEGSLVESDPDDTFYELNQKRRALPGAFEDHPPSDNEEPSATPQRSFLSHRSAGSTSNALIPQMQEVDRMDEEYDVSEDQVMASADPEHRLTAEHGDFSPPTAPPTENQEVRAGIMRAKMRKLRNASMPTQVQVADGDDWMEMLQRTVSPQKRDRALLRSLGDPLSKSPTRNIMGVSLFGQSSQGGRQGFQQSLGAKDGRRARIVSDGHGFATSIDLMNSLFEQSRAPAPHLQAGFPTKGFRKWPYQRQNKTVNEDEMNPVDREFYDSMKPHWGPDGTLITAAHSQSLTRSSRRVLQRDGLMATAKTHVGSSVRDLRFAKFSNESSAQALLNHRKLSHFDVVKGVPTVTYGAIQRLEAFFHGEERRSPADTHEKSIWELAGILFDDGPSAASQARKAKLSSFWDRLVSEASTRCMVLAPSKEEKALACLSGHRIPEACKLLVEGKDFRLATVVALINTDEQAKRDMRAQLKGWRDTRYLSEFSEPIRALYELVGGNACACDGAKAGPVEDRIDTFVISQRFGFDWKQAFGLRLWYAVSAHDDIAAAVNLFREDIEQQRESRPRTWYAEQGIPALWKDPRADEREDLLWGLLKIFSDPRADLEAVLRPENSQLSPVDYRLSWQLGRALLATGKVTFGEAESEKADAATIAFASQLTGEGSWLDAVFVLLHLTDPSARVLAIREHLCRHAAQLEGEQSESFATLTQGFHIPATWIWESKALYMRSVMKDAQAEVECLLKASSFAEAHRAFVKEVAPQAIVERDYERLGELLAQFCGHEKTIPEWSAGGAIYWDFIELMHSRGAGKAVSQSVIRNLLAGLPALHDNAQKSDILEVAAVTDMANIAAAVVAELAKAGKMDLSAVLGLPLMEDGYLKYSTQLASSHYKEVMAGRP